MKRSTDGILTTHTGSLPRPADLDQMLFDREEGKLADAAAFDARVRSAVAETVARQLEAGVSVVGDGEMGKIGYSTYVKDRLTGFGGEATPLASQEMIEFPEVMQALMEQPAVTKMKLPACDGPVRLRDEGAVGKDIGNLAADRKSVV